MRKITSKDKRKLRNRKKIKSVNTDKYRISVTKSLKNLSAQIIDDKIGKTLVSASSIEKEFKKNKLIKKLKKSYPKLNQEDIEDVINIFLSSLQKGLREGKKIELRGFGTFFIKKIKEK